MRQNKVRTLMKEKKELKSLHKKVELKASGLATSENSSKGYLDGEHFVFRNKVVETSNQYFKQTKE